MAILQQTNYPGTTDPMIIVQDDGSIYQYKADGKKSVAFEGNITKVYDAAENVIMEVTADTVGDTQVTIGAGAARIEIKQQDGTIDIYGDVNIHGSFNTD